MNKKIEVLIVEDTLIAQIVMEDIIRNCGYDCKCVVSGEDAVSIAEQYNLIFMDIGLPGIDGIEATRRIRSKGVKIPILALTAHGTEKCKKECFTAGMDDFYKKPLMQEQAEEILSKYFGDQRSCNLA